MKQSPLSICVAGSTKLGSERTRNGDEWSCVDLDESADYGSAHSLGTRSVLVAIADGGSNGGHPKLGSALALQVLHERLRKMRDVSIEERMQRLRDAMLAADDALVAVRERHRCAVFAALTLAIVSGEEIVVGHVGSTAAFLVRDGAVSKLTTESVVEAPLEDPPVSLGGHAYFPQLGDLRGFEPVITRVSVAVGDLVLFVTDGITDEREHVKAITALLDEAQTETAMAHALTNVGARDDATAIVLRIGNADYRG